MIMKEIGEFVIDHDPVKVIFLHSQEEPLTASNI